MALIELYVATSLDGFIASPDGGVEWLDPFSAEEHGCLEFIERIGSVAMGRKTFEQALSFGLGWPYPGKEAFILASREPDNLPERASVWRGSVAELAEALRRREDGNAWVVGGARTARAFLDAGAIDRIELCVLPVLLGDGIPLFERSAHRANLRLEQPPRAWKSGAVQLVYRVEP
jgi:dihydrofolate reductase